MAQTIGALAEALGATAEGDLSLIVSAPRPPAEAGAGDLAVAMDPKYLDALSDGAAQAAILPPGTDWRALGLSAAVFAGRPRFAMAGLTAAFADPDPAPAGIDPLASVAKDAQVAKDASIGPFVTIAAGARIGAGAVLRAHVSVGPGAVVGEGAELREGARLGARVKIGARTLIHPNAVIGADGFSFVTPEKGAVESAKETGAVISANTPFVRIHSLGAVVVGEDVEIGAGTTIDRGTLADTTIGAGTKIDNLVQIGHNVAIGGGALLCAQVGVAGSARIGDRVVLGGKVGVADHVTIGDDVVVAAASAVGSNVPARSVMMGIPAAPRAEALRSLMALRRLPRLLEKLGK